ncbi:hypothetical protein [Actinomadura nitritigenes]|uniref:hypothetical protein n=1 Tax=Actinomadura nitritigenes TaxID=134602 RepID=UPI003D8E909C
MSGAVVGEVAEWLRTPAAEGITDKERLVLFAVAERVLDERTREMRRFKGDDCNLFDRICQVVGTSKKQLGEVLRKLAERGLDVRVQHGVDKRGRPVYACRGHTMQFRLPPLPPTASLPPYPAEPEAAGSGGEGGRQGELDLEEEQGGGLAACG